MSTKTRRSAAYETNPTYWLSDDFWRQWSREDEGERYPLPALDRALDGYVPGFGRPDLYAKNFTTAAASAAAERKESLDRAIHHVLAGRDAGFPDNDLIEHIMDEDWDSAREALRDIRAFAVAKCVESDLDGHDP